MNYYRDKNSPQVEKPLVSIIVITYNSSKYVIETLESAKTQTYQNIELIVSDDCSTDNTVEICQNWIKANKGRFVNTNLITVEENTGIAPNCNRGVKKANGQWLELVAGDDILSNDCIEQFIIFTTELPENTVPCCGVQNFGENNKYFCPHKFYNGSNSKDQLRTLLKHKQGTIIIGSSYFIKKETLLLLGGYDERFTMWEDFPLFLKLTKNGFRFQFIDKPLVLYRVTASSVSNDPTQYLKNSMEKVNKYLYYPYLKEEKLFLYLWHHLLKDKIAKNNLGVLRYFFYLIDPIKLIRTFKRYIGK